MANFRCPMASFNSFDCSRSFSCASATSCNNNNNNNNPSTNPNSIQLQQQQQQQQQQQKQKNNATRKADVYPGELFLLLFHVTVALFQVFDALVLLGVVQLQVLLRCRQLLALLLELIQLFQQSWNKNPTGSKQVRCGLN